MKELRPLIGIMGAAGRMGRYLLQEVISSQQSLLVGAVDRPGKISIGADISSLIGGAETGIKFSDKAETLFEISDVVIDFSNPENSMKNAEIAADYKKNLVIGTTGLSSQDHDRLSLLSKQIALIWSANFSLGIALLNAMVAQLASRLDPETFDIEILEMHHRYKRDTPSGTALALGDSAAKARQTTLEKAACKNRVGLLQERHSGEIGFASLRGGDVVGDHHVIFAAEGERLELSHKASSRQIFARGALKAALWLHQKPAGLYTMQDVLDL
jgi:4-hydroxy-tetrahydrodipicolinate reductase